MSPDHYNETIVEYARENARLEREVVELRKALGMLLVQTDALLPGAKHLAIDVGALNTALIEARKLANARGEKQR